ncbi:hypothetical protein J6590_046872 [Homalodisca vitripennis]|nr:hypothetical protein J6590_046872 [Homalodisca vitripennis]
MERENAFDTLTTKGDKFKWYLFKQRKLWNLEDVFEAGRKRSSTGTCRGDKSRWMKSGSKGGEREIRGR